MIKNPVEGEPVIFEANDCTNKETMTFKNNGKLEAVYYHYDVQSQCVINETATDTYNWKKDSEEAYTIGRDGNAGITYKMTFPDANTLWMTNERTSGDGEYTSHTYVYTRL